ncbi:MAG TPA: hypothetical protein VE221_03940, partial [Sphingomicrobium sp.]|nr:hypothetical protein [Sphingomicrobium sp.]
EDRELFRHAHRAWEDGKIDLVELGTEMSRCRRELFDLVGSVAADTRTIDLKPVGDAIEELAHSGAGNHAQGRVPLEEEA